MPTTGGLDADGVYHPTWSAAGGQKVDPPGKKAEAAVSRGSAGSATTRPDP